ncbi:hypothetical protein TESG_03296 [Trichophyton tonsurans CBS 112818]|uniref:RING-type domain-containing protein n=1 Tax=Trichophyton tonsurans (strain CBS 112818) TaxID=647933 RepID=F2RWY3_TRIT1|nr:hypothetical protein TESG_03296 [Trichophyton tonsurans CBS 112818]
MAGLDHIASSLSQDEIPFKLRCAICSKLAWNAFRLPCCDQAICEGCQTALPSSCPVCDHNPLDAELCKPNKALRTTLKAFLRTEEKKREKNKPVKEPTPPAPAVSSAAETDPAPIPAEPEQPQTQATDGIAADSADPAPASLITAAPNGQDVVNSSQQAASGEKTEGSQAENDTKNGSVRFDNSVHLHCSSVDNSKDAYPNATSEALTTETATEPETAPTTSSAGTESGTVALPDNTTLPDGGYTSGFGQMGWNGTGDFTQGMPFMANGMMMAQNPMGAPGMFGMGMDPMTAAQGMFTGYGMNMNGMNSNMGMMMNSGAGQGMYGSWDGQNNMWNGGPDNFNGIAFPNRMGADFGPAPGVGGYNMIQSQSQPHQKFPHLHQQQKFPSNDFQNSYGPYGRGGPVAGRGGRGFGPVGRGRGYQPANGYQGNTLPPNMGGFQRYNQPQFQQQQQQPLLNSVSGQVDDGFNPGGEEEMKEHQPKEESADTPAQKQPAGGDAADGAASSTADQTANQPAQQPTNTTTTATANGTNDTSSSTAAAHTNPIPSYSSTPAFGGGPGGGRYHGNGPGFQSTPYVNGMPNGVPSGPMASNTPMAMGGLRAAALGPGPGVAGAPAAPRAMREGLPNTSTRNMRNFAQSHSRTVSMSQPSVKESRSSSPAKRDAEPDAPASRARSKSRSRSRSRSKSPSRYRSRQRRYRSPSAGPTQSEDERRRERRSKRTRRDDNDREADVNDDKRPTSRSRSLSPADTKSSSYRRRDRERDRDRDDSSSKRSRRRRSRSPSRRDGRAVDASDKSDPGLSIKGSSSNRRDKHRSREDADGVGEDRHRQRDKGRDRHRDRERERDRDRDRDRERDRERDRDRDRDRRDRKRSRRDYSESRDDEEYNDRRSRRPRHEDSNEQAGKSQETKATDKARPSGHASKNGAVAEKDPHTLEREARNRERLLKEQQRREAVNADRDSKGGGRRRDGNSKLDRNLLGRKLSYKYEDELGDHEREREAVRWS